MGENHRGDNSSGDGTSLAVKIVENLGPLAIEPARAYADRILGIDATVSQAALALVPLLRQSRDQGKTIHSLYPKLIQLLTGSRRQLGETLEALLP